MNRTIGYMRDKRVWIPLILVIVVAAVFSMRADTETLPTFVAQYVPADDAHREEIATRFLGHYSAAELLAALDRYYANHHLCHTEAHPLGRALYKKNPNLTDAIRQCGNGCSYGCFHGALMEMFKTESDTLGGVINESTSTDYLARADMTAKDLCQRPDVQDVVHARSCYHGLGHVFMYVSGNDVGRSLQHCRMWDALSAGKWARSACDSGVFMEYQSASSSKTVFDTKGIEPCDQYGPDYVLTCYHYKAFGWITAYGGAKQAIQSCSLPGRKKLNCIGYVGLAEATNHLMVTDADIDALCGDLGPAEKKACTDGVLLRLVNISDGDDSGRACAQVTGSYHAQCLRVIDAYIQGRFDD